MPRRSTRPLAPVPRYTLTRREAAASLGISINHFERKVQPELKVVLSGQLILIPVAERERRTLENGKRGWIAAATGQRRRARERAADARLELLQARRVIAERTHGAVPHDLELEREASAARAAEVLRERQAERMTRRERGFGREL